jgi:hypothetical protein
MKQLVRFILEKNFIDADKELETVFPAIVEQKLLEMKKAVAAKMHEGKMGIVGPITSEKRASDVLEEDDLEEMDLSREKPIPDSDIEDRRGTKDPNWFMKNVNVVKNDSKNRVSVPNHSSSTDSNKTVVAKSTVQESGEMGPVHKGKEKAKEYAHSKSGKTIMSVKNPGKDWKLVKEEDEQLDEARINIVKARIRGGKVQRRKKVSNVPGMTMRGGQLKRMSAAERRRRKMGQRKGKMKRKAKMTRSLMKRKRSLQKRRSLGL